MTSIGPNSPGNSFATTRWSLVVAAGQDTGPDASDALESLCRVYWYPLYAYIRRRVPDRSEAQDLTQTFFAELLEKNYVAVATPERGRFRAFLLAAFKNFLSKEWEKARAQKRGGGRAPISLDFASGDSRYGIEPATELTAEQFYDQQWTLTLLSQVFERLEQEYRQTDKARQFECLKATLIGEHAALTYAEIAGELEMTEAAVKMAALRLRRRYRDLLRAEIAQTVCSGEEVEEEIRRLFATLAGS